MFSDLLMPTFCVILLSATIYQTHAWYEEQKSVERYNNFYGRLAERTANASALYPAAALVLPGTDVCVDGCVKSHLTNGDWKFYIDDENGREMRLKNANGTVDREVRFPDAPPSHIHKLGLHLNGRVFVTRFEHGSRYVSTEYIVDEGPIAAVVLHEEGRLFFFK